MRLHRVRHDWSDLACMHALEKEMATHSSILAWRIPGTEEPGGLPSMGSHRVRHDWCDLAAAAAVQSTPWNVAWVISDLGSSSDVLCIKYYMLLKKEISMDTSNFYVTICYTGTLPISSLAEVMKRKIWQILSHLTVRSCAVMRVLQKRTWKSTSQSLRINHF